MQALCARAPGLVAGSAGRQARRTAQSRQLTSFRRRPRAVAFGGQSADAEADAAASWAAAACGVVRGERRIVRNADWATLREAHGSLELEDEESVLMLDHDGIDKATFAEIITSAQADIGSHKTDDTSTLFMVDGMLGPAPGAHVRAISDHAGVAALLTLMLRVVRDFAPDAAAPSETTSSESSGPVDLSARPDVVLVHSASSDPEAPGGYCATFGKKVVARGVVGFRPLAEVLAQAAGGVLSERKRNPTLCVSGGLLMRQTNPETYDLLLGVEPEVEDENSPATVLASYHVTWNSCQAASLWHCTAQTSAPEHGVYLAQTSGDLVAPRPTSHCAGPDRIILPTAHAELSPTETLVETGSFARRGSSQERVLFQALLHKSGALVSRGFP
ncbi:Hypothetical Protein FCC1311_069532 [Hondaea fermentalgiana]|uniref:Uncharacterized protein n=1 Tax=Hondaea fermentalgiana TaxID=2315210 RepID=A0A2R5GQ37_9STRA|nr:Hypothetical Protein FCC1311_069532 [Hondaea fermentalgiana]|eukprot:GBG30733.1 Hypothetical Protein FCC1311_069532 [Hondaea fermentalgiana]